METTKMAAGIRFPNLAWPAVGGGQVAPAEGEGWRLLVVYRGKHCPLCRKYLGTLNHMQERFRAAGVAVLTLSADPLEKAAAEAGDDGWRFPVGYDLQPSQMRALGLYISDPRSPGETDRPFAEPGVFAINPDGNVQVIDVSNAPFCRPDLEALLGGMQFVMDRDYPIRGRA